MLIRTLVPTLSYGYIVFLFVQALLSPTDHISFIYSFGLFIFVAELLTIHSMGMLSSRTGGRTYLLLGFYALFAITFSVALKTVYPGVIFALSMVAKSTTLRSPKQYYAGPTTMLNSIKNSTFGMQISLFIGSAVFVALFGGLVASLVPFPPEVYAAKPQNLSGSLVEQPHTLLLWGIVYYSLLIVWQIINSPRSHRSTAPIQGVARLTKK